MKSLLFVYDDLMTKSAQKAIKVPMRFVSFGQTNGKMYWFDDKKRIKTFCTPVGAASTALVYGGIFEVDNSEVQEYKLSAYYYSSAAMVKEVSKYDMFVQAKTMVRPIKFLSLNDLYYGRYEKGEPVECIWFVGNNLNSRIKKNTRRYYKTSGVDVGNFITMINERNTR